MNPLSNEQKIGLAVAAAGIVGLSLVLVTATAAGAAVVATHPTTRRLVNESLDTLPRATFGPDLPDGRRPVKIPAFDNQGALVTWVDLILPAVSSVRPPLPIPLDIRSGFQLRNIASLALENDFHEGVDLRAAQGTPVLNIERGSVSWITLPEHGSAAGASVTVRGDVSGLHTTYAHLSSLSPALLLSKTHGSSSSGSSGIGFPVGAVPVVAGQLLGLSGGTPGTPGAGRSTGPHLHLRIGLYASPRRPNVNPRDVLPAAWFA